MGLSRGGNLPSTEETTSDLMVEINITPLTDIFLVLLIIFMVTSSVISQTGVNVHLPQASESLAQVQSEGVTIVLLGGSMGGSVRIQEKECDLRKRGQFEAALRSAFSKSSSRLVILEGDQQAFLGNAVEVMERARQVGATKFALATTLKKNKN